MRLTYLQWRELEPQVIDYQLMALDRAGLVDWLQPKLQLDLNQFDRDDLAQLVLLWQAYPALRQTKLAQLPAINYPLISRLDKVNGLLRLSCQRVLPYPLIKDQAHYQAWASYPSQILFKVAQDLFNYPINLTAESILTPLRFLVSLDLSRSQQLNLNLYLDFLTYQQPELLVQRLGLTRNKATYSIEDLMTYLQANIRHYLTVNQEEEQLLEPDLSQAPVNVSYDLLAKYPDCYLSQVYAPRLTLPFEAQLQGRAMSRLTFLKQIRQLHQPARWSSNGNWLSYREVNFSAEELLNTCQADLKQHQAVVFSNPDYPQRGPRLFSLSAIKQLLTVVRLPALRQVLETGLSQQEELAKQFQLLAGKTNLDLAYQLLMLGYQLLGWQVGQVPPHERQLAACQTQAKSQLQAYPALPVVIYYKEPHLRFCSLTLPSLANQAFNPGNLVILTARYLLQGYYGLTDRQINQGLNQITGYLQPGLRYH